MKRIKKHNSGSLKSMANQLLEKKAPGFMKKQKYSDAKRRAMMSHRKPEDVVKFKRAING